MFVSKLKAIAATLLAIGTIASAMGLYASQAPDPAARLAPIGAAKPTACRMRITWAVDAADIEELLRRVRQEQRGATSKRQRVTCTASNESPASGGWCWRTWRAKALILPVGGLPRKKTPPNRSIPIQSSDIQKPRGERHSSGNH